MSTARCLAAVALLVAAGLPLGYALTRRVLLTVILAPLVSAATASVAIMAMLALGGPLLPWLAGAFAVQFVVAVLVARWWRPVPLPFTGWVDALWLLLPLLPPFLLVLVPPDNWDANSIWWLHAGYFAQGGEFARAALAAPPIAFSHPDYPPLGSAPVAAVWALFGRGDLTVAQSLSSALSFAAIAALAYCVRQLTGFAPALVSRLLAVGVALATWSTASQTVAGGQMDPLWSCTLAGAAGLLLIGARPLRQPVLAVGLLTVAALTKNEGLTTAAMVAALVTVRQWWPHRGWRERREWLRAWPVWVPVLAGGSWSLLARQVGVAPDVTGQSDFHGVLTGDPALLHRIQPVATALRGQAGTVVALAVLASLLGTVFLRRRRRALGLASDGWVALLLAGYTAILTVVYIASPLDIAWYLATSVARTSMLIVLLCAVSAACWAALALSTGAPPELPSPRHGQPDRAAAADQYADPSDEQAAAAVLAPTGAAAGRATAGGAAAAGSVAGRHAASP